MILTTFHFPSPKEKVVMREIADFSAAYGRLGWFPATSGNFSLRSSRPELFFVSRSGVDKSGLQSTDFVPIDCEGRPLTPFCVPSAESAVHLEIYRRVPEAVVVLHAHMPRLARLLSGKPKQLMFGSGMEILKAFGGEDLMKHGVEIPVAPNPCADDLTKVLREIDPFLHRRCGVVLFSAHGAYCWGSQVGEAQKRLEALETLCLICPS